MRAGLLVVTVVTVLCATPRANATWSIVAVDEDTGEVGVASATCNNIPDGIGVVPGVGSVSAQALTHKLGRDEILRVLAEGATPAEAIAAVANATFDERFETRQYGVAVLGQAPANFTGEVLKNEEFYETVGGRVGTTHNVTVLGNVLRGDPVLDDALQAFESLAGAVTLADRLITALAAGAASGGDKRCSEAQTALGAVILVAAPDDSAESPTVHLSVEFAPDEENPVPALVEDYEAAFGTIASRQGGSGCAIDTRSDDDGSLFVLLFAAIVMGTRSGFLNS